MEIEVTPDILKEEEEKKKKRENLPLTPFSIEEMNQFYSKVLLDPLLRADDSSSHMVFMGREYKAKKRNGYEKTPYCHLRGRVLSAQRVSYFLEYGLDPMKAAYIQLECNEQRCVNPRHLSYREPPPKKESVKRVKLKDSLSPV